MRLHVALEVRQQTEGLAALGAAVARELGVSVQREGVGEGLQTQGAVVEVLGVGFLVGEEGAGVTVRASAQVTFEALLWSRWEPVLFPAPLTRGAPVSVERGPSPEARPAVVAAEAGHVDPLVVVQDAGHSERLPAGEADVPLLLRVDARVVA